MSKAKGLLDRPDVLAAVLSGKYAVETCAGRFVGAYGTEGEAINAGLEDERAMSHTLTPPFVGEKRDEAIAAVLAGMGRHFRDGTPVPKATIVLMEIVTAAL
jgi:hypothetical protein